MSRKPRVGDVVEIEWLDSEGLHLGWREPSEYVAAVKEPQAYRTSGHWLGRPAGHALVVSSIDVANRNVTQSFSIPASAIVKLRVLSRASKATRKALRR